MPHQLKLWWSFVWQVPLHRRAAPVPVTVKPVIDGAMMTFTVPFTWSVGPVMIELLDGAAPDPDAIPLWHSLQLVPFDMCFA